ERLSAVPIAALYSSPLERCAETAGVIGEGRGLTVQLLPQLEEVAYGRWTGRPLAQLTRTSLWTKIQQSPSSVRFPEGETLGEVQRRAVEALDGAAARHRRGVLAAVSHPDVSRRVRAHYAARPLDLHRQLIVAP